MKKSKNAVARNLGLSICVAMGGVGAVPLILAASSAASFVQASEQGSEETKASEKKTDTAKSEGNASTEHAEEGSSLKSDIQEGVDVVQDVAHTAIKTVTDVLDHIPVLDNLAEGLDLEGLAHEITEGVGDIVDGVIDTALGGVTEDEEGDKTTGDGILAGTAGFVAGVISNVLGAGSDTSEPEEGGEKTSEKKRILQK